MTHTGKLPAKASSSMTGTGEPRLAATEEGSWCGAGVEGTTGTTAGSSPTDGTTGAAAGPWNSTLTGWSGVAGALAFSTVVAAEAATAGTSALLKMTTHHVNQHGCPF